MNAIMPKGVYDGPRRQLTRFRLRLAPLTPLHIGDGTEMRLEEYLLDGNTLCRFDPAAAMRRMTAQQRTAFRNALQAGKLGEVAKVLRAAGRDAVVERIAISDESRDALANALENPAQRSGSVRPFIRSGGRPYIPGSSIKGAFRTALASAMLPRRDSRRPDTWTHEDAMSAAFRLDPHRTETDPLRFLHVSDAALSPGITRIERVELIKRDARPGEATAAKGIQMHYELLPGRADAPQTRHTFDVVVHVDERAPFDRAALLRGCSEFHWDVWTEERRLFFSHCQGTCQAMDRLLKTVKIGDRTLAEVGPGQVPNYVLLRLGRFGHFESKSLAGVRRGHFPQAKPPASKTRNPDEWGLTRTVVCDSKGNPIPFGWVLGWVVKDESP